MLHQVLHWMKLCISPQILSSRVQIDLRAADTAMPEEIPDGHQLHPLLDQVGCKGVTQSMRRHPPFYFRFCRVSTYSLVDRVAGEPASIATPEKLCSRYDSTSSLPVQSERSGHLMIER